MAEKSYIGIDPGVTGAACIITPHEIEIFDWVRDNVYAAAIKTNQWSIKYDIAGAYIENVWLIPKDRKYLKSSNKLISNAGQWEGILASFEIKHKLISPKQWRKGYCYRYTDRKEIKKISLYHARKTFPGYVEKYFAREKDHNRAEAALIALQCKRFF